VQCAVWLWPQLLMEGPCQRCLYVAAVHHPSSWHVRVTLHVAAVQLPTLILAGLPGEDAAYSTLRSCWVARDCCMRILAVAAAVHLMLCAVTFAEAESAAGFAERL
jgi:hypothetical protein